jgi:hypothetical protein
VSLPVSAHHRNGRMHAMGAARHFAQHAAGVIKIFWFAIDLAIYVDRGVGRDHDDIKICVSLCDDMGFALCKSLHVCKWSFKFEWCFIDVSRLNIKRHFTFAKRFV